jgi:hypothetical protein
MGVLEARIGEPEVVEPVIERRPRDGDAKRARVGEVGQSDPAGLVRLPEDDLPLFPMDRPPGPDPALQSATHAGSEIAVAPKDLLEDCDRP